MEEKILSSLLEAIEEYEKENFPNTETCDNSNKGLTIYDLFEIVKNAKLKAT